MIRANGTHPCVMGVFSDSKLKNESDIKLLASKALGFDIVSYRDPSTPYQKQMVIKKWAENRTEGRFKQVSEASVKHIKNFDLAVLSYFKGVLKGFASEQPKVAVN